MRSITKREKLYRRRLFPSLKAVALFLSAVMIAVCFSGCNNTVVSTGGVTTPDVNNHSFESGSVLNLGISANDSLNPYFMTTDLNSDITSLVFEPLFYVDDTFCARNALADSYTAEGTTVTVKLKNSAAFSDGVQFSATDVVYSFNLAKNSANYGDELSFIASATASAADTVVFTSSSASVNAVDSLTFPIVKTNSADTADACPIGTGLYKYVVSENGTELEYNPYCTKPQPNITTIKLSAVDESSTLIHTLELGTIDAYFDDMSSGSYSQANADNAKTNLTNLVFLGINSNSYGLSSPALRQAVYYSINRQSVAKNSYKNYAVESAVPYHPEWHILAESEYDISDLTLDYSKAKKLMANAGFNDKLRYTLIVYSGNNFKVAAAKEIQADLANIGIEVTVSELTWENYKTALQSGAYDFYLGEIRLPKNMDMTALFGNGSAVYGASANDTTATAYGEFLSGNIYLEAFTESFLQNMPFVPICFRMGALIYSDKISPAADCDMGNAYKNIYEWSIDGTAN